MECETCERCSDRFCCPQCVKSKLAIPCKYWKTLRESVSTEKERVNALLKTCVKKCSSSHLKQIVVAKKASVNWYREKIAQVRQSLLDYKSSISSGSDQVIPDLHYQEATAQTLIDQVQKQRAKLTREAGAVLQINMYYPDWSIGDMFKLEKGLQYNQIVQFEDSLHAVDTSSHMITLKSTGYSASPALYNEEHLAAIYQSIYLICELLIQASKYLRVQLPFTIEYDLKSYLLEDRSGLKHTIDLRNMLSCETAMLYLYLDLRYLQQLQGVDLNRVQDLFDVKALLSCETLGQWKHFVKEFTPTFDLQLSSSVHTQELLVENRKLSEDWINLGSDDDS